jgi:D-ornithine 4,5-aminomutase subunit beta
MKKIHELAVEKGIRDKIIICAGGTQVTPEMAREQGVDQGFGRKDRGIHVATYLVNKKMKQMKQKK